VRTLLVTSQKKGVGKSAASFHLASAVARNGYHVLYLDADPLSHVSECYPSQPDTSLRDAGIDLPGLLIPSAMSNLDLLFPYATGKCSDQQLDLLLSMVANGGLEPIYQVVVINSPPFLGGNPGPFLKGKGEILLVVQTEPFANRTMPAFLNLLSSSSGVGPRSIDRYILTLPDGEVANNRWEMELRGRFGKKVFSPLVSLPESSADDLSYAEEQATESEEAFQIFGQIASELNLTPSSAYHPPESSIFELFRQLFEDESRFEAAPSRDKTLDSTDEFVLTPSALKRFPAQEKPAPASRPTPPAPAHREIPRPPPQQPVYRNLPPLPARPAIAAPEPQNPSVPNPPSPARDNHSEKARPTEFRLSVFARLGLLLLLVFLVGVAIRFWNGVTLKPFQPVMVGIVTGSSVFLVYWLLTARKKPDPPQKTSSEPPTPTGKSVLERRLDNIRQMHPPPMRSTDSNHHDAPNAPQHGHDPSTWNAHAPEEPPRKPRPSFPGIVPPRNY